MARGPRKTIEEKISAKQEVIDGLLIRVESEKRELEDLFEEKRQRELQSINELIEEAGLSTAETTEALQQYIDSKAAEVS